MRQDCYALRLFSSLLCTSSQDLVVRNIRIIAIFIINMLATEFSLV
jgi:hypothetical protein